MIRFQSRDEDTHDQATKLLAKWRPKETQIGDVGDMREKVSSYRKKNAARRQLEHRDDTLEVDADTATYAKKLLNREKKEPRASKSLQKEAIEAQKAEFYMPLQPISRDIALREKSLKVNASLGGEDIGDRLNDAALDLVGKD